MKVEAEQVLCRFQLSNFARHGFSSFYEWIVQTAHREGLHGATVLEGFHGMRADGTILGPQKWSLAHERPVIVEVVDEPARIEALLALVEPVFREGVITLERAHVFLYRHGPQESRSLLKGSNIIASAGVSAAAGVQTMNVPINGVLLRIFISETDRDRTHGRPLHEIIVRRAHEAHLSGATVLRGAVGFGRHSQVHTAKLLESSFGLPLVIEIVDSEEKIQAFLPVVDELVGEGLVTLEAVRIVKYASAAPR